MGPNDECSPLPAGVDSPTTMDGLTHVKFGYGSESMVYRTTSPVKGGVSETPEAGLGEDAGQDT